MARASRAPAFVVHDLAQALAVFAAAARSGHAARIESAAGAAGYAGAGFWVAVIAAARARHPKARVVAVLDCGAEPGLALGAVRMGAEAIRCRARGPARDRLKAIARKAKVAFVEGARGPALDLLTEADAEAAAARVLAPPKPRKAKPARHRARKPRPH